MTSRYLDLLIRQANQWHSDYEAHRADMAAGLISGDVAVEKAITLATFLFSALDEIGFYMRSGYHSEVDMTPELCAAFLAGGYLDNAYPGPSGN
jgi:hypothetical protein